MRFGVYAPTFGEYDVKTLAALAREIAIGRISVDADTPRAPYRVHGDLHAIETAPASPDSPPMPPPGQLLSAILVRRGGIGGLAASHARTRRAPPDGAPRLSRLEAARAAACNTQPRSEHGRFPPGSGGDETVAADACWSSRLFCESPPRRGKMALRVTLLSRVDAEQPPPRAMQHPGEGRRCPRSDSHLSRAAAGRQGRCRANRSGARLAQAVGCTRAERLDPGVASQ
jgi:hypothetical protein